jgi:hypothetical protein
MTDEENKAIVAAEVKSHFAPKQPEPKMVIDPKAALHCLKMLSQPPEKRQTDYDRCITKTFEEKKKRENSFPARRTAKPIDPPAQGVFW